MTRTGGAAPGTTGDVSGDPGWAAGRPRAWRSAGWILASAALAVAPLVWVLASGRTLAWRDTARLFAPLRVPVVEALRGFRLPLWNPHEALGVPVFAQLMHGVLHPVSVAFAFLAPSAGVDGMLVAHVLLAAAGCAALARLLGASPPASAAAGVVYGMSGYALGMTANLQYLAAAGTAPWTAAALRETGRRDWRAAAWGAAAVAAQIFAGDPQWATVATFLGLALALEAGQARGLLRAAAAVLLGAALGAIQLVPTWASLGETTRAAGFTADERLQWALAPVRLVELVAPGFFAGRPGPNTAPVYLQLAGPTQFTLPFLPSVFVGAVTLILAAWGARASRASRVLLASGALFLWLSLGGWLGADAIVRDVPIWGSFRYAEKLVGPLTLCLAVLAGLGADRIGSRPRAPAAIAATACAAAVGLGAWLALAPGAEAWRQARAQLAEGLAHAAGALGLLALLLAMSGWPAVRRRFPALLAGLLALEAAAASPFALYAGARSAWERAPLTALRSAVPVVRIAVPTEKVLIDAPAAGDWDGEIQIRSRLGEAPFSTPAGIDQVWTYTGLAPRAWSEVVGMFGRAFGPERWLGWRRFALTHVVVDRVVEVDAGQRQLAEFAVAGGRPVLRDPEWGFTVWEVPRRPWAFFAEEAEPSSPEQAVALLRDAMASGRRGVILEGPAPRGTSPGRILAVQRGTEQLRIEAETDGEALLVVNDAFWPGWRATVDGRPVEIQRADALVRAVPWPPGRHLLEMSYRPRELGVGAVVTAVGALATAGLLMAGWRARLTQRTRAEPTAPPSRPSSGEPRG